MEKGREIKAFTGLTAQKTIYLEACPRVNTQHLVLINSFMTLVQRRKFWKRFYHSADRACSWASQDTSKKPTDLLGSC